MKRLFICFLFFYAKNCYCQFKTTFQHDRRGNRISALTSGQSSEVLNSKITVINLQKNSITFAYPPVNQSGIVYRYQMPPYVSQALLTTYSTSLTEALPNPNETLYQLSVSHQYPQGCIVAAYLNIMPPFCQTELNLGISPESSVFINQSKNFAASQVVTSNSNVNKGGYAEYEAGKSVTLLPGFTAEKGSVFKANLNGCNN